jgi:hypothetical protein
VKVGFWKKFKGTSEGRFLEKVLQQVGGFLWVLRFTPSKKLIATI